MRRAVAVVAAIATSLLAGPAPPVAGVEPSATATPPPLRISTVEEITADLALLGCDDDESRYATVGRLFAKAGARPEDVSDFTHRQVRNLVVTKAGASPETIVIGAHYDKTPLGCGAVDNWTGLVAMAHLYASLRDVSSQKSLVFVAFDDEELGLLGSHAMARRIPKAERPRYCAMINIDSLGLSTPQVLDNASSKQLRNAAAELAETMGVPFDHARLELADSDSTSFLRRGIPAVTIHGLSFEGLAALHTDADQPSLINPTSVYMGYRLALALLAKVDGEPCDAFR